MNDARATQGLDLLGFDRRGLVCGYALSDSKPVHLDRIAECGEAPLWLHFNIADARARKWLTEQAELPAPALDLLLEPHPRVRVTLVAGGVGAILHDLHHDFRDDPEQFGELRFSIVTAVLLPATLVTGVWGMNVGGLPWAEDSRGFLYTVLVLLASIVVSLVLLRRARVL